MQVESSENFLNKGRQAGLFVTVMLLIAFGIAAAPSLLICPVAALIGLISHVSFKPGIIRVMFVFSLSVFVILESSILLFMIRDNIQDPILTGEETLIIPGAAVNGREPGLFLRLRLNEALKILEPYSEMPVIVTGFQSEGSLMSEAKVMKNYLSEHGILEDRIFMEDMAYDTIRNFEYSSKVIEEEGLARSVIIVTNDFHAFRSTWLAKKYGLNPISRPVLTPPLGLIGSLFKEAGSWIKVQLHVGL